LGNKENSIKTLESNYKKLIADAREHFKKRNIESRREVSRLKEEDTEALLETKYKIESVGSEDQKSLSELEEKYKDLKSKSEQLLLVYNDQVEKWEGEKKEYKKIIQTLQKELELKELEIKELEIKEQDLRKRELRRQKLKERESKEQEFFNERVLKKQKNSRNPEEVKEKSKTILFDIISTFLIVGVNFLFVFVVYPNIAYWVDIAGLNDLSLFIRILITMLGIIVSLFYIIKAKKNTSKKAYSQKKKRGIRSLNLLFVIIVVGAALLFIFLFSSNFLFFIVGTLLIVLAGLIAVINYENPDYF